MAVRKKITLIKILRHFMDEYQWRHRNTIFIIVSIFFSYAILTSQFIHNLILSLSEFGYLSSFVVGMFYTYAITTIPATVGFFLLGESLDPARIAIIGAAGAVFSDYIIYRFVKDSFVKEIEEFSPRTKRIIRSLHRSKFLRNFLPVIAGFIIASPLPDELGAALLGIMRFKPKRFLSYAYFFNFIGILLISTAAKVL